MSPEQKDPQENCNTSEIAEVIIAMKPLFDAVTEPPPPSPNSAVGIIRAVGEALSTVISAIAGLFHR